jgi:dihydroorotase-like cyclic amidohydrolase
MQLISRILAGQLFDPYLLQLVPNQLITVSLNTGLVLDVCSYTSDQLPPETIDLRHLTVVPGFVDAHVHCASAAEINDLSA